MRPAALLFLAFFVLAGGLPQVQAEETVRVHATVVVASNEGSDFNLDNDAYRDQLIKLFSYSAYHQTHHLMVELKKAERARVELPEGYELVLTLQGSEKGRVLVQALIRKGDRQYVDTILSILRPGVVFLGGPPVEKGALIIVLETGF